MSHNYLIFGSIAGKVYEKLSNWDVTLVRKAFGRDSLLITDEENPPKARVVPLTRGSLDFLERLVRMQETVHGSRKLLNEAERNHFVNAVRLTKAQELVLHF